MTRRDEGIRMARDAGFVAYGEDMGEYRIPAAAMHSRLKRFADMVAAAKQEQCAKACIALAATTNADGVMALRFAAAIRALNDEVGG